MLDKRRTHWVLATARVPVPAALDQSPGPLTGWADLSERVPT
ncbi:hypothetical protein [Kitasatospora griseola]